MIGWAGEMLLATSLLAIVVLIIREPVARAFGARAAYALWLVPLARLASPPIDRVAPVPDVLIATIAVPTAAVGDTAAAAPPAIGGLLLLAWLGGAAAFLAWQVMVHWRFVGRVLAEGRVLPFADPAIELVESSAVDGPIATGIWKRRIVVPEGFDRRLTAGQQRLALSHELLHHRRGDLMALSLASLVLALHWFNPIAYWARRAFRSDLEAACDSQLVELLGPEERQDYARAILGCAASRPPNAICALTSVDDLKRRLKMLASTHGIAARFAGFGLVATLSAGGLALASPSGAAPPKQDKVERVEVHRLVVRSEDGKELPDDIKTRIEKCEGEKFESASDSGTADRKEQVRIVLCGDKGQSGAALADKLEKAVERIESESEIGAEHKAKIVAELKAKIAELRRR